MAEVEHDIKIIPIDNDFKDKVEQLSKEGYELTPGVVPIAVYRVVRLKGRPLPMQGGDGNVKLAIDESRIIVIGPDGKPK